jgi:hypothetical protein
MVANLAMPTSIPARAFVRFLNEHPEAASRARLLIMGDRPLVKKSKKRCAKATHCNTVGSLGPVDIADARACWTALFYPCRQKAPPANGKKPLLVACQSAPRQLAAPRHSLKKA